MSDRNIGVYILFRADTAQAKAGAAEVRDAVSGVTAATEAQARAIARTVEARRSETRAARDLAAAERDARAAALDAVSGNNARWNAATLAGPRTGTPGALAAGANGPMAAVPPAAAAGVQALDQALRSTGAGATLMAAQVARSGTAMTQALGPVIGLTRGLRDQSAELVASQREAAAYQAALDGLRARFNPLFAASQAYEAELRDIAEAERLGAISALEAAAARDRAAQALAPVSGQLGAMGDGLRQTGHYAGQLTYQLNDIGMMMAMGQSPFMLMMQQGPQVAQVFDDMRAQGMKLGPAIAGAFGAMLHPISLATMAAIGFGAVAVQWLVSMQGEAKTFDERLTDLTDTLGRMRTNLDVVGRVRLSETFGSLTSDVRGLAQGLLELDRASELKQLQSVVDDFLKTETAPSWWQTFSFGSAGMMGLNPTIDPGTAARMSNYDKLGAANSFDDFKARTDAIGTLAGAGDVPAVIAKLRELQAAMAGGGPLSGMSDEARKLLAQVTDVAMKTAEIEAAWNGTAKAAALSRQLGEMSGDYERQAELTRVVALHGEQSAEAEAVRARHLREGLEARLAELNVDSKSTEAVDARAALEARIAADAFARGEARKATEAGIAADLGRQQALSQAILQFGEDAAEVEALRAMQAREVFRARLAEQGIIGTLADDYVRLMEAEQDRQRRIRAMNDGRTAKGMLETLDQERAIKLAILGHGENSLRVQELQIAAERRLYEESVARLQVSEAEKKVMMERWDLTHGLASPDPFGRVAANRDALRSHQERMDRLQLELRLVGHTNAMREKAIAMHEAEVEARKVGGDVAEWRARAGAMADLTREVQRQTEAWDRARQAAEGMIDGPIDALMKGDLKGALESFGQELLGLWSELALKNPLKNRLLGTDYATIDDIGGLQGFFGRLFGGQPVLPSAEAQARTMTTAAMSVTTPMVTISTSGLSGLPLAAGLMPAANLPVPPAMGPVAGPSMAAASLHRVAIGGALRPDALTGLNSGFAGQLAAMVTAAEAALGPGVVKITSAFRSVERQAELFEQAVRKYGSEAEARKWVAPPGKSNHNAGLAADLDFANPAARAWVHGNAARFGLGFPMSWEPWHIEPANARAMRQAPALPVAQLERLATTAEMATGQLGSFGARAETTGQGLVSLGGTFAQALQMFGASKGPGGMIAAALLGGIFKGIGIPGFDRGGWTGAGAPTAVAGLVHAEEYVFDAASTRRIGVANLEAIRRGRLPGYQSGGLVTGGRPVGAGLSGPGAGSPAAPAEMRHLFEINVSGTGDAQIAAGVRAAITRAFDEYDRTVFAGRVRMVMNDDWAA